MQTVARHDIGLAAEDAGGTLLHVHQLEQTELAFFMFKKRSTSVAVDLSADLIVVAQVLFAGLFFSRFSKPNTGATAVLVDELDAGSFQGSANGEVQSTSGAT